MDRNNELIEVFKTFLPKYLSPELQADLSKFIAEDFPLSSDPEKVYAELINEPVFLQGDCIEEIPFSNFITNPIGFVTDFATGILISNTCDVAEENERIFTAFASFSMVHSLDEYLQQLRKDGISGERIQGFVSNLKKNRLSGFMYLPQKLRDNVEVLPESFIRFDRIANVSTSIFNRSYSTKYFPAGNRLFSFSSYGFFLFITKLSVHFCRFRENVIR